jgi:hypothetical protein
VQFAVALLDAFDRALFRLLPLARRFAWIVVIVLAKPSNAAPA